MISKEKFVDLYLECLKNQCSNFSYDIFINYLREQKISRVELELMFPAKELDLLRALQSRWNQDILEKFNTYTAEENISFSKKIELLLNIKIESLADNTQLFRYIMRNSAMKHIIIGKELMQTEVNFMLEAAHDQSLNFDYYTKRAILGAIYFNALICLYYSKSVIRARQAISFGMRKIKYIGKAKKTMASLFDNIADFLGIKKEVNCSSYQNPHSNESVSPIDHTQAV